jgi:hypothetical protein
MIKRQGIDRVLSRYGSEVSLSANGTDFIEGYRAFVQPLRYKNKMYLDGVYSPIGHVDQSFYLYVGPAWVDLTQTDRKARLKMGESTFFISHCERVQVAGEPLYVWAILRKVM